MEPFNEPEFQRLGIVVIDIKRARFTYILLDNPVKDPVLDISSQRLDCRPGLGVHGIVTTRGVPLVPTWMSWLNSVTLGTVGGRASRKSG